MAPLVLKQLWILLWKSWIIRKRHWVSALFELLFPIALTLIMAYVRYNTTKGQSLDRQESWTGPVIFDGADQQKNFSIADLFRAGNGTNRSPYSVFYAPNNSATNEFMREFQSKYKLKDVKGFSTADELATKLYKSEEEMYEYGVEFIENPDSKQNLKVKIRVKNDKMVKLVKQTFADDMATKPTEDSTTYEDGFTSLQIALSERFIEQLMAGNVRDLEVSQVSTHRIPYPKYLKISGNEGGLSGVQMAGMMIVTGYVIICPLIVKRITDEKVAKAKEMLRMMGMSDWVFWGSHFISFFVVMVVQSAVNTVLYIYGFGALPYVLYSNGWIFFVALVLFNITSILSSMVLTTVFNRPIIAVVVSVLLFMLSQSVPMNLLDPTYNANLDIEATHPWRILTCMLPNAAMGWIFGLMSKCESNGYGVSWNNLWDEVPNFGHMSVGYVMLLQFISIFFYGLLIWYVDNVWPFQFGIPKPLHYPFLPSYWLPNRDHNRTAPVDNSAVDQNANHFEREPTNAKVGIKCQHLRKVFRGVKKVAVNDVSLNIYCGQITVLLGHNGAGKTTTMNMITGIFPPSQGTALIDGYDIRTETKEARRSMALCPQDNIVYNELSVAEHLRLYAVLKDHPTADVDREVDHILDVISLADKRNALANQLSGGMKRKLCLGIAMVANSKILILDEPTSGMDPEARRHIWDVLQNIREERTILLTTHYMEEADQLGDRIAIMSEGGVKCCGTPMFLKKAFGAGYQLRIAKGSKFSAQKVLSIVRQYLPNASIKSEIHSEIIYSLESDDKTDETQNSSPLLAQLFSQLESRKAELDVDTCGLTVTTMEDVFIRVGNEFEAPDVALNGHHGSKQTLDVDSNDILFATVEKNTGFALWFQHFRALFLKRFHFAKRYWPMVVLQSVVPGLLFMCILLLDQSIKKSLVEEVRDLNLSSNLYGETKGFIRSSVDPLLTSAYESVANARQQVSVTPITENPNNWTLRDPKLVADIPRYLKTYLMGAEISGEKKKLLLTPWYNKEGVHSLPQSLNLLYESLLQYLLPNEKHTIEIHNHPVASDHTMTAIKMVRITLIVSCLLLVPLTVPLIGASYVLFPIHERVSNSKLLQLMTGISSTTFWAASYLFDLITHFIASIFLFIIFAIFDWNKVFIGSTSNGVGLFLMFFLFGVSAIPLSYLFSLRLKLPSTGYAVLVIILLLTGLVLVLTLGILDLMISFGSTFMTRETLDALIMASRILPVFSMSYGIQKLYKVGSYQKACRDSSPELLIKACMPGLRKDDPYYGCCEDLCHKDGDCYYELNTLRFDDKGVAVEFLFLIGTGVFFLFLLWLIEGNFERILYFFENRRKNGKTPEKPTTNGVMIDVTTGQWVQPMAAEDSDVTAEKRRIADLTQNFGHLSNDAIVVNDLSKRFGKLIPFQAVDHLSFGVHKEECFGLLGVNGAGKTTTFRMLTGDETLSEGNAWIQGLGLRQELKAFQKQIGYCPQFDALLNRMTGRETLYMFCRLRGMKERVIGNYVRDLVAMVDLGKHVDKCTQTYSGGNKRKLSLAIALCAAPPVIFLDEPTSGVDPTARRKIWATLASLQERYGSAFILTSHSMEECEALCSRVAIMVNGQFQCLGSVQHLRTKFGQGFTVMVKLRRDLVDQSAYMADIQTEFQKRMPSAVLKDVHQCLLHYHIADTRTLWSSMFAAMEDMKAKYSLEDYVISDTTLEQIFLSFARKQR